MLGWPNLIIEVVKVRVVNPTTFISIWWLFLGKLFFSKSFYILFLFVLLFCLTPFLDSNYLLTHHMLRRWYSGLDHACPTRYLQFAYWGVLPQHESFTCSILFQEFLFLFPSKIFSLCFFLLFLFSLKWICMHVPMCMCVHTCPLTPPHLLAVLLLLPFHMLQLPWLQLVQKFPTQSHVCYMLNDSSGKWYIVCKVAPLNRDFNSK